ncbi:hypothetical protein HY030_01180 [Candidatus Gottesmanbacteria bacterium]|nr:hypothetical protein [Candidatus Gottesmanbacteria bacterium]
MAIGQGYLLVTPLQVNFMTNVIASGGKLCRPKIGKWEVGSGKWEQNCQDVGLKKETIALIKEGMKEACSIGGTGWPFFDFKIGGQNVSVGCKTGTAEFGDPKNRTHAWFTVFAPWDKPKITLTVLVEGAGEGSNIAAPIAKKVLEGWLPDKLTN